MNKNNHTHSPEELQAMFDDMKRVFSDGLEQVRKHFPDDVKEFEENSQAILDDFQHHHPSVK